MEISKQSLLVTYLRLTLASLGHHRGNDTISLTTTTWGRFFEARLGTNSSSYGAAFYAQWSNSHTTFMTDKNHIPKGVGLDTLLDILAGWAAVGAAAEPQYTSEAEDLTGVTDAVGRQTRFLEDIGVLEAEGKKHELTEAGKGLTGPLVMDEREKARERARELLTEWPVTEEIRGIVRENPMSEEQLAPLVAGLIGEDPDTGRA